MSNIKRNSISLILLMTCLLLYVLFTYGLEREDFLTLMLMYTSLFLLTWKLYQRLNSSPSVLFAMGFVIRLALIGAIPNLSQDFYRFIWDGNLLLNGLNPYLSTPQEFMSSGKSMANADALYRGMGALSAGNYTNYPPLNQLIFAFGAWFGNSNLLSSVIALRLVIISADLGVYVVGRKLLQKMNLSPNRIFWYFLNPFVILELTGNLHFEGIMMFFLVGGLYLLREKKWIWSALCMSCAIAIKLLPLIFLPLLFRYLNIKRLVLYYVLCCGSVLLFFIPFVTDVFVNNYLSTVGLWFQEFEFNGSIYYVIRWLGYHLEGYNIIQSAGPLLGTTVLLLIVFLSMRSRNKKLESLLDSMLFAVTIYLFLATTVHPWYLITPLLLSVFTRYTYSFHWSYLVVLSYYAYSTTGYQENLWLIALEYGIVFSILAYELHYKKPAFEKHLPPPERESPGTIERCPTSLKR